MDTKHCAQAEHVNALCSVMPLSRAIQANHPHFWIAAEKNVHPFFEMPCLDTGVCVPKQNGWVGCTSQHSVILIDQERHCKGCV